MSKVNEELTRETFTPKSPKGPKTAYGSAVDTTNPYLKLADENSDKTEEDYVRLIFYGGSKKHDDLFKRAAIQVNDDYQVKVEPEHFYQIVDATTIVDTINSFDQSTIQSVDIFCHGGPEALYFKKGRNDLYKNNDVRRYYQVANYKSKTLDDIDYGAFTESAKIELHGCNSGSLDIEDENFEPFAELMSEKLSGAGKGNAVVIAHGTKANPNAHKTLDGDDYRHSLRRVFNGGENLFRTKKEGRLTATDINKFLRKKEDDGENYDGASSVLEK